MSADLRAHPRSRGENPSMRAFTVGARGSSPLTRGKLRALLGLTGGPRLIPAHAGKTVNNDPRPVDDGAHPRSRGENCVAACSDAVAAGSSPLTRGKQGGRDVYDALSWLIPAHAGKTSIDVEAFCARGAHPRSRGEN